MTFTDWLEEQNQEFWRKPMAAKLHDCWEAARREGRFDEQRLHPHRFRLNTPSLDRTSWE